jgi:hypothetical protein
MKLTNHIRPRNSAGRRDTAASNDRGSGHRTFVAVNAFYRVARNVGPVAVVPARTVRKLPGQVEPCGGPGLPGQLISSESRGDQDGRLSGSQGLRRHG